MEFNYSEDTEEHIISVLGASEAKAVWGMETALQKTMKESTADLYSWGGSFKVTLSGYPPLEEEDTCIERDNAQTMNDIDAYLNKGESSDIARVVKKRKAQAWTDQLQGAHSKIQALAASQALLERPGAQRHGRTGDEDRSSETKEVVQQMKQPRISNVAVMRKGQVSMSQHQGYTVISAQADTTTTAKRGRPTYQNQNCFQGFYDGSPTEMETTDSGGNQHRSSPTGWQVEDLELDLAGELSNGSCNMTEALMSLPGLTVFKQEAPSPPGGPRNVMNLGAVQSGQAGNNPRPADQQRNGHWGQQSQQQLLRQQAMNAATMTMGGNNNQGDQQLGNNIMQKQSNGNEGNAVDQEQIQGSGTNIIALQQSSMSQYDNNQNVSQHHVLLTSQFNPTVNQTASAGFSQSSIVPTSLPQHHTYLSGHHKEATSSTDSGIHEDMRFQYVLGAATSIATKTNEETLTYLNQGQPYEIRLKKLGDLVHYRGKILKSIVRICFHERRLQYMEREQMALWHNERQGERIVEVDVPLSYGLIQVLQPNSPAHLNTVEVLWDPMKEAGVYIKVNCISTEFTAKKHGGEKGVPFRIQVETYLPRDIAAASNSGSSVVTLTEDKRLHAAACQIKVFKLKGADRKHKQDREKVLRRPLAEQEKFQPSYECTVLTTLSNDALLPPPSLVKSQPYSPDSCNPTATTNDSLEQKPMVQTVAKAALPQSNSGLLAPVIASAKHHSSDESDSKSGSSPTCLSPSSEPPVDNIVDCITDNGLPSSASRRETVAWLTRKRFITHQQTLVNFSASDLLRLTRDDLIQICGLADGIRLYNALHAKRIEPRLTIFARGMEDPDIYTAIYMHSYTAIELRNKLTTFIGAQYEVKELYMSPATGARVRITDEVVRHMRDQTSFYVRPIKPLKQAEGGSALLLIPTEH